MGAINLSPRMIHDQKIVYDGVFRCGRQAMPQLHAGLAFRVAVHDATAKTSHAERAESLKFIGNVHG
jgi:hypothetical protein